LTGLGRQDITIVPILVGAISTKQESYYGSLLAPYLADPENFFVVSSDFCHW
jgi:predicted class III extradiol MEMO1 family dioxygenase